MRVDLLQVPSQGGLKVRTGADTFISSLKEGDSIKAEVLSSDKGAVTMRTDDGQAFRARLEADVELVAGDRVLLEMTGKEAGIVTLSIRGEAEAWETSEQQGPVRGFEDKTLLPYAEKLAELNIPVTEETASMMREIISLYPGMSLEEAAFIASNKLAGDESLIKAALAVISDGEKTDAMLERLMTLLLSQGTGGNEEFGIRNSEFGINNDHADPELSAQTAQIIEEGDIIAQSPASPAGDETINSEFAPGNLTVSPDVGDIQNSEFQIPNSEFAPVNPESLSEWIALIEGGDMNAAKASLHGEQTPAPVMQEIIPHNNSIMQSRISENNVEMMKNNISAENTPVEMQQIPENTPAGAEFGIRNSEFGINSDHVDSELIAQTAQTIDGSLITAQSPARPAEDETINSEFRIPNSEFAGKAIAGFLSELDEFRGTPAPVLERFSNMLLRVANENAGASAADAGKLLSLFEKMFTRIEKSDADAGARLKSAKEELFARLTFLEEAISRAEPAAKTLMLDQTRRLMDHVRLLNSIDQFVYMQLPVQIGEERRTAELYMFKKKNSKRLDPENVNILLALDLENMGHWEGLINIRNKDVSIRMEVAGPDEKEYFSEKTILLHELLADAGFRLVGTDITYSEIETTPLIALSVFDRLSTGKSGGIDYIV